MSCRPATTNDARPVITLAGGRGEEVYDDDASEINSDLTANRLSELLITPSGSRRPTQTRVDRGGGRTEKGSRTT